MNVLIAGDFCPQNRVAGLFKTGQYSDVLKDVHEVINRADYSIVNLECPISSTISKPIKKQGPSLRCEDFAIRAIQYAGFDCVTLANNHILDYGPSAAIKTMESLEEQGIDYVGCGRSIKEASKILYKDICGQTLAIINCCEHEFSIAQESVAGANPLEPITQFYQILEAKKHADFVIMIIHGGVEHFQYPTKRMVQIYRFFADAGADLVINHHQHCPCGYENYKGKTIFYGLGNFCFDWNRKQQDTWNYGYMVSIKLNPQCKIDSAIIPYCQCGKTAKVELLEGKALESFMAKMLELCSTIQDEALLEAKFTEYNYNNDYLYRKMLEPYSGRFLNGIYRRGLLPSTISEERVLALIDFIGCESHSERVKEFLDRLYKQYIDEQD